MESKTKSFKNEVAAIAEIENMKAQKVILNFGDGNVHLSKSKKEFKLNFKGIFHYPTDGILELRIKNTLYKVTSSDFEPSRPISTLFDEISCEHNFDIDGMSKGDITEKVSFRMFFFDTSKRQNLFHYKLESPKYDGVIPWAFDCARLTINSIRYDIVQHKQDNNSFIIIENLDPISFEKFKIDSYAIQKGIGFLIGYMPGGEQYIFSGSDFEYRRLAREPLKSIYYPVTRNPYSFSILHGQKELADRYQNKLSAIPSSVISTFVSQILDNEDLSVAIIFLMEASHLKSVISMPGVFSVILESLANIIINPLKINPTIISDKELAQEIIAELNTVIDKYSLQIHQDGITKIRRRLRALNQPINVRNLTNAMKLREPFDQLGIKLSPSDEQAIDYRNYLLHGNILMNDGTVRNGKEIDQHMLYISAKLYTLISKLILKNCGFSGYVINQAKFYNHTNAAAEPDYFNEI